MPAYNASEHIIETLDSVIQQTYTNWELILVNDCSTDTTVDVVKKISEQVSNPIKIITNETNSGVSVSRNVAVANAAGTWLALLDADDIWLPNHLETLIGEVRKDSSLDLVYAGCLVFLDKADNVVFKQEISQEMVANFNVSLFTHQIGINPCTALIAKNSWNAIGGMIPNLNHSEEKELFIRLAKRGGKFKFTEHHTALYRKYSTAIAASNNIAKMALGSLYVYEKHFDWEAIPLKIRIDQLANAHLSYARIIHKQNIKLAEQHSLKALKLKKSLKNACYFAGFSLIALIR